MAVKMPSATDEPAASARLELRPMRRLAALCAATLTFAGLAAVPAAAVAVEPLPTLVINEVESNGGIPGDWIELYNTGDAPVDAAGLVLKDNDDTHRFEIPAGTTIAAHSAAAFDVETAYGLGKADSARLYLGDGSTLIDSYSWTAHADETYGRCPDGIGAFVDTDAATKGAPNQCPPPAGAADIRINEVESNGGTPGDWVELYNTGSAAVDLTGWIFRDNDDSHTLLVPAQTLQPGAYTWFQTDVANGFGLGSADSARLFLPDGATVIDSYTWSAHAATTYGRCPDGTGAFVTTLSSTQGSANDCQPLRLSEIESSGGTPGDWIELVNLSNTDVDASGYVLKDNDDSHVFTIPVGTTIPALGYAAFDVESAFGLGSADSARLFSPAGDLVDTYSWTAHAATTYARCPDPRGAFAVSAAPTKGEANSCIGEVSVSPWPGSGDVRIVDTSATVFAPDGKDLSGLVYEASGTGERGTLWAVNNGGGTLFRLQWTGTDWAPAPGSASSGTVLHYADGTGAIDSEGVTIAGGSSAGGVYVASERDNSNKNVGRPSVLRYDVTGAGASLNASDEWNLSAFLPVGLGANSGLEGIAWIPDAALVAGGLIDESTLAAYSPASYAGHGDGLFFVGVEGTAKVYAVALLPGGVSKLVATIDPGLGVVAEVAYDAASDQLWALCDDACNGEAAMLQIADSGPHAGSFQVVERYANPAGMLDSIANEGFAFATADLCVDGTKPVFYADDNGTDDHALREGSIDCTAVPGGTDPGDGSGGGTPGDGSGGGSGGGTPGDGSGGAGGLAPSGPDASVPAAPGEGDLIDANRGGATAPGSAVAGSVVTIAVDPAHAGKIVHGWIFSTPTYLGVGVVALDGSVSFTIPAGLPAGDHRIAVVDASGAVLGWSPLTVELAQTGAAASGWLPAGALLLGVGVVLVTAARRPRRA
ncbi:lamin tail domain-containing protein [Microbacterium ginsengisoli]|nr:lamin tail domain-containing protein [Microbacterium ginsengisoli]